MALVMSINFISRTSAFTFEPSKNKFMKKLICHLMMTVSVFCLTTNVIAQTTLTPKKTDQQNEKEFLKQHQVLKTETPIKFQLSTTAGVSFSGARSQLNKVADSYYSKNFEGKSISPNATIDYYFWNRAGLGIGYSQSKNTYNASYLVGSEYYSSWFIWYFEGYNYYYDQIEINSTCNLINTHFSYKLVEYSRQQHQLFEITTRGGLSLAFINEQQLLTATAKNQGYEQRFSNFNFNKTAVGAFLNLQLDLHVTKYFSFVLVDITQNFGLINPTIPETSVSIDNIKTVTANQHKNTASGFTITTGLAVSF